MVSVSTVDGEGEGRLPTNAGQKKKKQQCLPEPDDREPKNG